MPQQDSTNTFETINYGMFQYGFDTPNIPGPYADDAAAASAGVKVGDPYYVATGEVFIRLV